MDYKCYAYTCYEKNHGKADIANLSNNNNKTCANIHSINVCI